MNLGRSVFTCGQFRALIYLVTMKPEHVACPCCGYHTLGEERQWEVCPVCWWEDDPVQFDDPDFRGGANVRSLNEAKDLFRSIGVADPKMKGRERPPNPDEIPGSPAETKVPD
jgi:hypothetical protein